jgi:hypothetical protein
MINGQKNVLKKSIKSNRGKGEIIMQTKMANNLRENRLYAVAYQCAELYDKGCDQQCNDCPYNIFIHTDAKEAALLKANAYSNYVRAKALDRKIKSEDNMSFLGGALMLVLFIGLIGYGCSSAKSCVAGLPNDPIADMNASRTGRTSAMDINYLVQQILQSPNSSRNIPLILEVLQQQGVRDRNRDGKVNCIDYSITFRELYGSGARLIINRNPHNGMNHMFIEIWVNGNCIWVEPQGTPDWYSMGVVWGTRYDRQYNRDVTSEWGMITGGM